MPWRRAESADPAQLPAETLKDWLREFLVGAATYRGVAELMTAAIDEPGAALLARAQEAGVARADIDGTDLFALASATAWLRSQPALDSRADHLSTLMMSIVIDDGAPATVDRRSERPNPRARPGRLKVSVRVGRPRRRLRG